MGLTFFFFLDIFCGVQYCFPGMWLSDLTRGRYEVREKKCVKKVIIINYYFLLSRHYYFFFNGHSWIGGTGSTGWKLRINVWGVWCKKNLLIFYFLNHGKGIKIIFSQGAS